MMQSEEPEQAPNPAEDRRLWQRCRTMDADEDEAARFLDLAAYADGLLDIEEQERVAALLAADPEAAADVRAARALAAAEPTSAGLERIIARASAISPGTDSGSGKVVPLAPRQAAAFSKILRSGEALRRPSHWPAGSALRWAATPRLRSAIIGSRATPVCFPNCSIRGPACCAIWARVCGRDASPRLHYVPARVSICFGWY